jgi:SAM-dependent methyltransferase
LLDALHGLGLVELDDGAYRNAPDAAVYLVPGRPGYLGDFASVLLTKAPDWTSFADVVRTGVPVMADTHDTPDSPFWEMLVPAIAPTSAPAAAFAADHLRVADAGEVSILDVGGGSGIFSATWLAVNPRARSTQLDWSAVNAIAREFVARHGVGDRFSCIDGDLHTTDYGTSAYDIAIFSHVAHQEGPEQNVEILRKLRRALKPGGTLVLNELIVDDDRGGPRFPLIFAAPMLLQSKHGTTWCRADYRRWLADAGFTEVTFDATPAPSTVIFAK